MLNPPEQGRPGDQVPAGLFEPIAAALLKLPEPERYRMLGAFLTELAGRQSAPAGGPAAPGVGVDTDALAKKLQRLGEEKALLEDALAAAKSDLARRIKQLEAEQQRSGELERIVEDQRNRLQSVSSRISDLEAQLVAKNQQLHEAENRIEGLTVKAQRAETKAGDTARVEALEQSRRDLSLQVEQLRRDLDELRAEKDATIEQLKTELAARREGGAGPGTPGEGAGVLATLWERLARAKPALAAGGVKPTPQAAERLIDAFVEMARFASDFDQGLRPFLGSFIKHNQALARPWEVYARSPALHEVVREVIDVEHGKPAGVLKMRLLSLQRWTLAAIIGSDTALASIAQELEAQLRGPVGIGADPNRRIRDYLRDDGQHLFGDHMRELRSQKLAEAYAHAQGG